MGIPFIGDLIDELGQTARQLLPNKEAREKFELAQDEIKDRAQARIDNLSQGQIETNKIEAEHKSVFVAGWRPALGWVGAAGAATGFIIIPIGRMLTAWWEGAIIPDYPMDNLIVLMGWMLGQSAIRSYDLKAGTAGKSWNGSKLEQSLKAERTQIVTTLAPVDAEVKTQVTPASEINFKPGTGEESAPWTK